MDLLGGYGSESGSEGADVRETDAAVARPGAQEGSASDDDSGSDSSSEDSEQDEDPYLTSQRRAEELTRSAQARNGEQAARNQGTRLPSALDVLDAQDGEVPGFLAPDATRPMVVNHAHGAEARARRAAEAAAQAAEARAERERAARGGPDFDIATLVTQRPQKRPAQGAVISAAPTKRPAGETSAPASALEQHLQAIGGANPAALAMLGGAGREGAGEKQRKPSGAMGVDDFLARGVGGAQLPRKKGQDRAEKEKQKRARGQSTHHAWKSEAEMALRQQYD
ncbi:unnamed protein product [Pedinophyceae sp. YPF-701]|nr:unnamed protein product [Pedinophyceae sp. YPF-701]